MPSRSELEDDSVFMTDQERRDERRFDAAFAFERMPDSEFQMRNLHPAQFAPKKA